MKSAVIVFPGSNCDRDLAVAFEAATGSKPTMVWHRDTELPDDIDLIGVPGGFSYGDYLRSGAMAARSPVMQAVARAADRGVAVLGAPQSRGEGRLGFGGAIDPRESRAAAHRQGRRQRQGQHRGQHSGAHQVPTVPDRRIGGRGVKADNRALGPAQPDSPDTGSKDR